MRVHLRGRSYLYKHLKSEEEVAKSDKGEEASRKVGVPLRWSLASGISNATTFVVRTVPAQRGTAAQGRALCRRGTQLVVHWVAVHKRLLHLGSPTVQLLSCALCRRRSGCM